MKRIDLIVAFKDIEPPKGIGCPGFRWFLKFELDALVNVASSSTGIFRQRPRQTKIGLLFFLGTSR